MDILKNLQNLPASVREYLFEDAKIQKQSVFLGLDTYLLVLVLALSFFGLIILTSSSSAIAETRFNGTLYFFGKQAIFYIISFALMFIVSNIKLKFWYNFRGYVFIFSILLLFLVLIIGSEINGAKRWISLSVITFQPAEFAKIATIIFVASYLFKNEKVLRNSFAVILNLALPLVFLALLLLLQPDFGSFVVIFAVVGMLIFISGVRSSYFILTLLPVIALFSFLVMNSTYRLQRLNTFLHPWDDPFGSGYQLIQALIAIGQGDFFGKGLGESIQKLLYLPDSHTDFIVAILAEELGWFGLVFLLFIFSLLIYRIFKIGNVAQNLFSSLLCYGAGLMIALQVAISFAVNLGLVPTKGLVLPFFSYGGSNLLFLFFSIGIVFRVAKNKEVDARI